MSGLRPEGGCVWLSCLLCGARMTCASWCVCDSYVRPPMCAHPDLSRIGARCPWFLILPLRGDVCTTVLTHPPFQKVSKNALGRCTGYSREALRSVFFKLKRSGVCTNRKPPFRRASALRTAERLRNMASKLFCLGASLLRRSAPGLDGGMPGT